LCFVFYTVWFISGKPTINIDYLALLNQMARPQLRDDDNAWPYYQKAINLYVEPVKGGVVEEFIKYRNTPNLLKNVPRFTDLSIDEQALILKWIKENQKHWDNITAEQKAVILKCFQYNSVPIFIEIEMESPLYTTFEAMTNHVIRAIKQNKPVTDFNSVPFFKSALYKAEPYESMTKHVIEATKQNKPVNDSISANAGYPAGFPDSDFMNWIRENKVPTNFLESVSVAVLNEWMKRYKDLPKSDRDVLTDTEFEYLRPWINSNESAWQEFVKGSSKSYCYNEYTYGPNKENKSLFDVVLPHLSTIRGLARFSVLHSRINLKEGKTHQALEDCLAVVRAGRHWQGKGTIIEQLVGIAISALAREEILHITATQDISSNDLKQIQQQLSEIYADGYPLINMKGERLVFQDIVQRVFTDRGPGGGHLIPDRWTQLVDSDLTREERDYKIFMPISTAASMIHAGRNETLAKANELYDRSIERAKKTPYERHIGKIDSTEKMLMNMSEYRFFLIRYFAPALERASDLVFRSKASHEATITILALMRYRLDNKEYPANLDKLIAVGYLKELPMDPFSNKPLVYKRTNDGFMLYSVGFNYTDDGGRIGKDSKDNPRRLWAENGDSVFWPLMETEAE
jgi:hypothetical protein